MNSVHFGSQLVLGIAVGSTDPTKKIIVQSASDAAKLPIVIKGNAKWPQWSSDGTRILYSMTSPSGLRDLWVVNSDGSHPINLTKGQGDNYDASYSPARH